jgi:ribosomal protein L37AE/L43A
MSDGGGTGGAWLLLAVSGRRQHGGNDGYDDSPAAHYSWDSTVPNHAAIQPGHMIALWDKYALLGCSVVEKVEVGSAVKAVYKCPGCRLSGIKARSSATPLYKCYKCQHEFDTPVVRPTPVTTYRSYHELGWVDLNGLVPASVLRTLCVDPASQLSLRRLRWEDFSRTVRGRGAVLGPTAAVADTIRGGHRRTVVRARVGQGAFRRRLLDRSGPVCAFTGAAPPEVLEACHLYSYASVGEHHDHGGLLLRRDIHRLFDTGLLTVRPDTLTLDLDKSLAGYEIYSQLQDQPVLAEGSDALRGWLRHHRALHREEVAGR